ncbi:MAG: TetR/AcrR family transcriptional regulator [Dehalococcoidia bacterium]|nr:TetR/AcrR family transcriptional regulator [Dehalococcoidia bacterium]
MATRSERKELITERRRRQILDAALAVFSTKGYGEATISDIAREAGIAVGTIYNYYPSKREVLVSILASRVLSEPFLQLMEQPTEVDDKKFFSSLIEERLTLLTQNADKFLFMLFEAYRDHDLRRKWAQEVVQPAMMKAEQRLRSRTEAGAFRPMNPSVTARALAGMAIGFAVLAMIEGESSPCRAIPRDELASELADFVLTGLGRRGNGSSQSTEGEKR